MTTILAYLMVIAEKQEGKQTVFDPETNEIYYSTGDGLIPILSPNEYFPMTHLSKSRMLSLEDVLSSEKLGENQIFNGFKSEAIQINNQKTIKEKSENNQTENGKSSRSFQKLDRTLTELRAKKIIEDFNLTFFSHRFEGKIFELSFEVENYTVVTLYNTNKKPTIKKIKNLFDAAAKLAAKNKDFELGECLETLIGIRNRQLGINQMHKTVEKKQSNKRLRLIIGLAIPIIFVIFLITKMLIKSAVAPIHTPTPIFLTLSEKDVQNLIVAYCKDNDTTLTEWRKSFIIKNFPKQIQENDIEKTIKILSLKK